MTDGKVLDIPTKSHHSDKIYIRFMVGECPHMPGNPDRCDYFLRFSSKVSGRLTTPAEPYIRSVYKIAKKYFGSRVHFWHEMVETGDERQWGYYDWREVHDADRKLRELETGQEQDLQNRALEERVGETNDEPNLPSVILPTRANLTRSARDVDLHLGVAWAQHLTGPEIAKFVLDCDESKTPVSAKVQKELQEVAAATLNDMPKPTSGMRSDREYLVQVLQAMRQRKGGDETFKSLIDRGIEVAHGEALVTVEETHNDGQTDEQEKWVPCDSDYDRDGYSDSHNYDDYHEPLKDLSACDKECGYCGQCDY
jgi:hypothetical protein